MNERILAFLRELRTHNNREWFQANKERFDRLRLGFIDETQELINRIALFDPDIAGVEAKNCLFRIYRDIRFSPDKTPYKCHFSAYISRGGRASERAGYYIHLEPDGCLLSGGVWCPPPALLKKLRRDIYDRMDEFVDILEEPAFRQVYPELEGETLRRMPAGYPTDTPHGDILKHKDFCVVSRKPDTYFLAKDWAQKTADDFRLLLPFNRFLNETVDDFLYGG